MAGGAFQSAFLISNKLSVEQMLSDNVVRQIYWVLPLFYHSSMVSLCCPFAVVAFHISFQSITELAEYHALKDEGLPLTE